VSSASESAQRGGEGILHLTVHRNKRSLCLDLTKAEGREAFHRVAATSRPVTRLATKALSNPIRGASFWLIVSVSHGFMG
jgi:hypothetical protein